MGIVVFGATGYTGRLTVAAMVRRGLRPRIAGRDRAALDRLSAAHGGLDTALADATKPDTVRALVAADDVLVTTVGPFLRRGRAAADACIAAGAHYLDASGEPAFVRRMYETYSGPATKAAVVMLPAFGHDFVPGHACAGEALRRAGAQATRVEVAYFLTGRDRRPSAGSLATFFEALDRPGLAWRDGRLVEEAAGERLAHFDTGRTLRSPAFNLPSSEHIFLPRTYPQLRRVDAWLGWFGAGSYWVPGIQCAERMFGAVSLWRPVLERVASLAVGPEGGPSRKQRSKAGCHVLAVASGPGGTLARAELRGTNVYDHTAELLAWGAERVAAGDVTQRGVLGPLEAFDLDALLAANREAGVR